MVREKAHVGCSPIAKPNGNSFCPLKAVPWQALANLHTYSYYHTHSYNFAGSIAKRTLVQQAIRLMTQALSQSSHCGDSQGISFSRLGLYTWNRKMIAIWFTEKQSIHEAACKIFVWYTNDHAGVKACILDPSKRCRLRVTLLRTQRWLCFETLQGWHFAVTLLKSLLGRQSWEGHS